MSDIQEEVQSAKEENTSLSRKKKLAIGVALALVAAGSPFIYSHYAHTQAAKLTSELESLEFKELAGNEIQYKILNPTYERKNLVTGHSEMELVINYQGKIFTLPLSNEVSISGKVTSHLDTEKMSNEAQSFLNQGFKASLKSLDRPYLYSDNFNLSEIIPE